MTDVTHFYTATGDTAVGTAATDIFLLTAGAFGARITQLWLAASQVGGSAAVVVGRMERRSSANAGGTTTAITPSKHMRDCPAALSTTVMYSAPPSALGAKSGAYRTTPSTIEAGKSSTIMDWPSIAPDWLGHIELDPGERLAISVEGMPSGSHIYVTIRFIEIHVSIT